MSKPLAFCVDAEGFGQVVVLAATRSAARAASCRGMVEAGYATSFSDALRRQKAVRRARWADAADVPLGKALDPEYVRKRLAEGKRRPPPPPLPELAAERALLARFCRWWDGRGFAADRLVEFARDVEIGEFGAVAIVRRLTKGDA